MRLLGGLVGSPVLAVGAGSMVDVFEPRHLSYCLGIWGSMAALGPLLGPMIGGYAFQNLGSWRWTVWTIAWMSGFVLALIILLLPETSAEKLLSDKARRLRKETEDKNWRTQAEKAGGITLAEAANVYLIRPFALLAYEPIGRCSHKGNVQLLLTTASVTPVPVPCSCIWA
jgi:DHA1 family multidrug resistance protein-like MFS transporter